MLVIWLLVILAMLGAVVDRVFARWKASRPGCLRPVPPLGPLHPVLCMSATELSAKLRAGELRSVDVVRRHIEHIRLVNPFLNAVVFDRFDAALEEARTADAQLDAWRRGGRRQRETPGWLCGVPCTIKECFAVAGCPNTAGHPGRVGIVSTTDAPPVQRLRAAGAIVLGSTNLSEMCMWMESGNRVYGITKNPHDPRHIVGGSSGGEGAAIAAHFSPFGLGSDIGGSIRMPAYFNGIMGHKPSTRLVPNSGQHPGVASEGHFLLTTGPLCRHVEDLLPLMRTLACGGFLEDPMRFPWCNAEFALGASAAARHIRTAPSSGGGSDGGGVGGRLPALRVFVFEDCGFPGVTVSATQRRAVAACADALERVSGVQVLRLNLKHRDDRRRLPAGWEPLPRAVHHWAAMVARDDVHFEALMAAGSSGGTFPAWTELGRWLCNRSQHTLPAIGLCILERLQARFVPKSVDERSYAEGQQLKQALWRHLADDGVIITPTYPVAPPRHHHPLLKPIDWQYTALFNAMEMPATAVPVWLDRTWEHQQLPLGVQVAAGWGHDGLAIAVAERIVTELGAAHSPRWTH